jgi:putative endonuclease
VQLTNRELGQLGEDLAEKYLLDNSYIILDRNFRCNRVELDIIARDRNTLVFCEVKTRRSSAHGHPAEAITALKLEHIRTAALGWMSSHRMRYSGIRFDAIEVRYGFDGTSQINHIRGIE